MNAQILINRNASVGIAAQLGSQGGGIGFTGSVSKGSGNGSETTNTNTHVVGSDSVRIKSGSDTTLKGATVEGKKVAAKVGGNLNIESLQDTAVYAEKNQQIGASGMFCAGASGNVNYAKSNINSNYASVTEQSALKAGDGGFTVNVKGNTDLKGGAITSTQAAIDQNKNPFSTGGTLTTSDIENKANYEAKSVSVSGSIRLRYEKCLQVLGNATEHPSTIEGTMINHPTHRCATHAARRPSTTHPVAVPTV